MNKYFKLMLAILTVITLAACSSEEESDSSEQGNTNNNFLEAYDGTLEHVHGIGYAGDQNKIFFAAHDGMKIYENGNWFKTAEQNNDYMGFSAVKEGFYTSGHPGEGNDLPNPLGLMRSYDNGKTLEELALQGQTDFHAMGVGYISHTVYALNQMENDVIGRGLFVTKDDGKTWTEIEANNLGEKIFSIAVHPTNEDIVAVAGEKGIFLSKDGGNNFSLIAENKQGTSVFISNSTLWYGTYNAAPELVKYSIESEEKESVTLPTMDQDAVMYFSQNPSNKSQLVFVTFNGNAYISEDSGSSWNQLVKNGEIE